MIVSGFNPSAVILFDATAGPITFRHEDASVEAVRRFHLRDACDYTLPIGQRAVVHYDDALARNCIVQVLPIPEDLEYKILRARWVRSPDDQDARALQEATGARYALCRDRVQTLRRLLGGDFMPTLMNRIEALPDLQAGQTRCMVCLELQPGCVCL
jgi:hypothetical protein